jgi:hypothetical protein
MQSAEAVIATFNATWMRVAVGAVSDYPMGNIIKNLPMRQ